MLLPRSVDSVRHVRTKDEFAQLLWTAHEHRRARGGEFVRAPVAPRHADARQTVLARRHDVEAAVTHHPTVLVGCVGSRDGFRDDHVFGRQPSINGGATHYGEVVRDAERCQDIVREVDSLGCRHHEWHLLRGQRLKEGLDTVVEVAAVHPLALVVIAVSREDVVHLRDRETQLCKRVVERWADERAQAGLVDLSIEVSKGRLE